MDDKTEKKKEAKTPDKDKDEKKSKFEPRPRRIRRSRRKPIARGRGIFHRHRMGSRIKKVVLKYFE